MIPRTEIIPAPFYQRYIDLIKEEEIGEAIKKNTRQFTKFLEKIPRKKIDYAYAESKWTIRESLQHIIDAERVFTYRALRFSRLDPTPLPGFDENEWAANAGGANRSWKELKAEFAAVREATTLLFGSLSEAQLLFKGEARELPLNAFTIGFIVPGHVAHHINIFKERYL